MYKSFFGLRANPFNVSPDPRFLYLTRQARETLACLTYGIQSRKGFVLVSGEVGTGKTTLLNRLMEWLRIHRCSTAFIFNPRLQVMEFLEYMMADFGIPDGPPNGPKDKAQMLLRLNQWLLDRYRSGQTAVLVVDEAQNLSPELLEEIRLLTNLETPTEKLLQIVLCGQPELEHTLKTPQLRQLYQRITLRCRTLPLTAEESDAYIAQRLKICGANGAPIFSREALELIHQYSGGIPRVTNLLCEHALISAYVDKERPVSPATISNVARELDLVESSPSFGLQAQAQYGDVIRTVEAIKAYSAAAGERRSGPAPIDAGKERTR